MSLPWDITAHAYYIFFLLFCEQRDCCVNETEIINDLYKLCTTFSVKWWVNAPACGALCGGSSCPLPLSRYDLMIKGHGDVFYYFSGLTVGGGNTSWMEADIIPSVVAEFKGSHRATASSFETDGRVIGSYYQGTRARWGQSWNDEHRRCVRGLHLGSWAKALGVKISRVSASPPIELIPKSIWWAGDILITCFNERINKSRRMYSLESMWTKSIWEWARYRIDKSRSKRNFLSYKRCFIY